MTYWRWYTNNAGDNPSTDPWNVEVSNNSGQSWVSLENTTLSNASWKRKRFVLSEYVELTNEMQLKFIAEDTYNDGDNGSGGSLVEAAIDDVFLQAISGYECDSSGDLNQDGVINVLDIVLIVNIILDNPNPSGDEYCYADLNSDNIINVLDIVLVVNLILN